MKLQLRGHCQACGRLQAVTDGFIAHHGYTVEHGYFNGTCGGAKREPIETSTKFTTVHVNFCRTLAEDARQEAIDFESGKITPASGKTILQKVKPWAELTAHEQAKARDLQIMKLHNKQRFLLEHADFLEQLITEFHGKPLVEVKLTEPNPPISYGERRVSRASKILTATEVLSGKVRWIDERGFKGIASKRMWRSFELLPEDK